jgi:glucosamine 6-phosphate synthetase-like amidotransferase/phosphosugar isomerase protein
VRGARTITIGEEDARLRANGDDLVVIPKSDAQISALLGVLPLQLLSYHECDRGFDPDFREFIEDLDGRLGKRMKQSSAQAQGCSLSRRKIV